MLQKIKKHAGLIVCIALVVALIPVMTAYSALLDKKLSAYIKQTMGEISEQSIKSIHREANHQFIMAQETASHLSNVYPDDMEAAKEIIDRIAATYEFKRVGIIDKDGSMFSSDGEVFDTIMEEEHIKRAFAGETVISDVIYDMADQKSIFVYAAPIYDKKDRSVINGVYFTTCDSKQFKTHLSVSAFDGKGYSYIVKSDGTTVTDSDHPSSFQKMRNVFLSMKDSGNNDAAIATMAQDMYDGKTGMIVFSNKINKYMYYAPLGINDWYILNVVPADVMEGTKDTVMLVTYTICAVIIIIGIILVKTMLRTEKTKREELAHILYHDELTGGMTFEKFCREAEKIIADDPHNLACVAADLDNFRLINSLYGRAEGDRTIIHTYVTLKKVAKKGDILARRVADRFFLLVRYENKEELDARLNQFCTDLESSWTDQGSEYILKPSIGVYFIDDPTEDIEAIANNAVIAHDIIVQKREHTAYYDENYRNQLKFNKSLEDRMEYAHKNHEFIPYFQPKYNAVSGRICGAEALIRWKNPDGSITMPGKFVPLAESNGFIRVLDRDMFAAVCAFQKTIIDAGMTPVPISVNVSRQLMYEASFAQDYIDMMKKYQLPSDLVELEITESALFDDFDIFRDIIDTLRDNGFRILMDDFGTGYSSLMMLRNVPIDNLKLDKSFIDSYEEEKGQKIITCVVDLAKSLSLPLTAEGVETKGQYDFLKDMGCNVIQGYYFSRPVTQEQFTEMLSAECAS